MFLKMGIPSNLREVNIPPAQIYTCSDGRGGEGLIYHPSLHQRVGLVDASRPEMLHMWPLLIDVLLIACVLHLRLFMDTGNVVYTVGTPLHVV